MTATSAPLPRAFPTRPWARGTLVVTRGPRAFARRALVACAAAASLVAAPLAQGEEDLPVRLQRATAIRVGPALLITTPIGGPSDLFEGVTLARQVSAPLALELGVGGGGDSQRNGLHLGAAARVWAAGGDRAGLTVALGTRVAFLREYGTVGFAHLEAAYELRLESGFNVVAGGGYGMPLNTSRRSRRCDGEYFFCRDRFVGGAPAAFMEGQVGWSF